MPKKSEALVPINAKRAQELAHAEIRGLEPALNAAALTIQSDEDYEARGFLARKITTARKNVEGYRKKVARAIAEVKTLAEAPLKDIIFRLDTAKNAAKDAMDVWEKAKEKEAEEEREKERKKAEAQAKRLRTLADQKIANAETRDEVLEIKRNLEDQVDSALATGEAKEALVDTEAPKPDGMAARETWDYETLNIDRVPRKWLRCEPRRREILKWANENPKAVPNIPGLAFYRRKVRSFGSL